MGRVKTLLFLSCVIATAHAANIAQDQNEKLTLYSRSGFFRFSYDQIKMPQNISSLGLMGLTYYADINPYLYAGAGGYGAVTGTQGGLFVLGFGGGLHFPLSEHLWADGNLFVGGGGGRSSLVGGGLMIKPSAGIEYEWRKVKLGVHYSYVTFPSGKIHSSQVGVDLDLPFDFYYTSFNNVTFCPISVKNISIFNNCFLDFSRNDFAIILQAYRQKTGTLNVNNEVQDGTIYLVGAEFDHYFLDNLFWYVKTSGAFSGIPNGYMDVLGGLGYKYKLNSYGFALIPQLGVGAGGGGNVDSGGGILIQPQLGFEIPLTKDFAARFMGGYLWAPGGQLRAFTGTAALLYHLDIGSATNYETLDPLKWVMAQGWRIALFNQTYFHPERVHPNLTSSINLVGLQIDQYITPNIFFAYQATSAYAGDHSGGYATGMIGPGIQTPSFFNNRMQAYAELLVGAGGGGSLALGGGAIWQPVIGAHFYLTPGIGLVASASKIKAFNHNLNTTVMNLGLTFRFGTVNDHTNAYN